MADNFKQLIKPEGTIVSILLSGAFFLFMLGHIKPLVPSYDPVIVNLLGAYTTACLTGVFFMASVMFRLVLADERQRKSHSPSAT